MPFCLIAQPIHPIGTDMLEQAGFQVRCASAPELDTLANEIGQADAVLVRDAPPARVMDRAPNLKVIANHGTGTDAVDVAHATQRRIPVIDAPVDTIGKCGADTPPSKIHHRGLARDRTAMRPGHHRYAGGPARREHPQPCGVRRVAHAARATLRAQGGPWPIR